MLSRSATALSAVALSCFIASHLFNPNNISLLSCSPSRSAALAQRRAAEPQWLHNIVLAFGLDPETAPPRSWRRFTQPAKQATPWFIGLRDALEALTAAGLTAISLAGCSALSSTTCRKLATVLAVDAMLAGLGFGAFTFALQDASLDEIFICFILLGCCCFVCGGIAAVAASVPLLNGLTAPVRACCRTLMRGSRNEAAAIRSSEGGGARTGEILWTAAVG